ncbi:MAG TPA: NAD(P)/FAD-dependent oxidoreductase [Flexivirga sp.]|uniref:NAD(P)/FAD-dependent oxidoreductase n=1 Tax=Flexivirga sp. TaxID=1962927 RepID=UPI002B736B06|nr:NAD(P)/FAD-dependent oxidoreductase [Flexivirga sp.]HWC21277.1 NAD(P)/FAD-dependent oxidoreductase [Flexivirga sp.]
MTKTDELNGRYDVAVIGGGAAGLSGALMLGRSRRSVLVIDSGAPRNAPAAGIHGLLGYDGMPPAEYLRRGTEDVLRYGGTVTPGEVVEIARDDTGFAVTLADGRSTRARRILLATGLVDELPDVEGLAERWGRDLVHCPYCHGWEVRDRAIAVLATGPMAFHTTLLWRQLSDRVVLLRNGIDFPAEQLAQLAARGVRIAEGRAQSVVTADDAITGVAMVDGRVVPCEVVAVGSRMVARGGEILSSLGLTLTEHPSGMGSHLATEAGGRTDAPGVWAAGNITDLSAQVGAAAAAGAMAGAQINADLAMEEAAEAVGAQAKAG